MDQAERKLITSLLAKMDKEEQKDLTPLQKLELGYKERQEQKDQTEAESFRKYLDKDTAFEDLTPLEIGGIREKERQLKQDKAREELSLAMEQLKQSKAEQRNWLNQPTANVNTRLNNGTRRHNK